MEGPVLWGCAELWLPRCCIPALLPSDSCLSCPSETPSFQQVYASTISLLNCSRFYDVGLFHTCPSPCPPPPHTHTQSERMVLKRERGKKTPWSLLTQRIIMILPGASLWVSLSVVDSLTPLKVWLCLNRWVDF